MRAAPPVSVLCSDGFGWRAVQAALPALAAGVLVWWALALLGTSELGARVNLPVIAAAVFALAAAALAGMFAWRSSWQPAVALVWDSQRWTAADEPGAVDVMMDLGRWLLLRHRPLLPGRRAHWVAVSAHDAGPAWHGLRAALYALPPANFPRVSPTRPAQTAD